MQSEIKNINDKNFQYIPLSEAAEILSTSRDYTNVLVRRGKLRAVKLGRNWVTTKEWIEEYRNPKTSEFENLKNSETVEFQNLKTKLVLENEVVERLKRVESRVADISAKS